MIPDDDSVNPEFDEAMSIDEALQRFKEAALEEHQDKPAEPSDIVPEGESQLVMFKGSEIRKICHEDEWWFSIVDVVGAVSQSSNPSRYWSDLKREISKETGDDQLYDNIVQLAMPSADGEWLGKCDCMAAQDGYSLLMQAYEMRVALEVIAVGEGCMNGIREELNADALRKIARAALSAIKGDKS